MSIIILSGGFDPVHSGHIFLMEEAKKLGDILIVGLNSDEWLVRKKGKAFMPFNERKAIISAMGCVDAVHAFNDDDGTARELLENVKAKNPNEKIVFANGGDRTDKNIPEMDVPGIEFAFGVGGENKANSSSWILEEWNPKPDRTETRWGWYDVIDDSPTCKVKELVVLPGRCLSYQQHDRRGEVWVVKEGYGKLITNTVDKDIDHANDVVLQLSVNSSVTIQKLEWHQLINDSRSENLKIMEVQYGDECIEEDIRSE